MSNDHPHHRMVLAQYLVRPCPGPCRDPKLCFFYHNAKDRRRNPFGASGTLAYSASLCELAARREECLLGDSCAESHSLPESLFHPLKYKTGWCKAAGCVGPALCHQAHRGVESLRHFQEPAGSSGVTTASKHLNLQVFKTALCSTVAPHNPKLCEFYHSTKDRRRKSKYSLSLCESAEHDSCADYEGCKRAHNRVEQLYHVEKYKTKFCTLYPNSLSECEYGSFCSFAHSENDIKIELLHCFARNFEFYVFQFKTVWCPFTNPHDKGLCVYAHNWQDYRRKPEVYKYGPVLCSSWKTSTFILSYEEGGCENMLNCKRCHGWKEIEYHPSSYKTRPCPAGGACSKAQDCPLYHSYLDQRSGGTPLSEIQNYPQKFYTPHPHKAAVSPTTTSRAESFTPFVTNFLTFSYQPTNRTEEVRKVNASGEGFALHRGLATRRGLNAGAKPFCSTVEPELEPETKRFLVYYKLLQYSTHFSKVKYSEIPHVQLPVEGQLAVAAAWEEEQQEQLDAEELIMDDIAIFTGQKEAKNRDLGKYSFRAEDARELMVKFESPSTIPNSLKCPITKKVMRAPTIFALDGKTYEKEAISAFLRENYPDEESARLIQMMKPNLAVRQEIVKRFE